MYAEKLKELGVTLPAAPGKGGLYAPTKTFGENNLMYVSACGCKKRRRPRKKAVSTFLPPP